MTQKSPPAISLFHSLLHPSIFARWFDGETAYILYNDGIQIRMEEFACRARRCIRR